MKNQTNQESHVSRVDDTPPPPPESEGLIENLYKLIGESAILLPCQKAQKGPRDTRWKDTTLAASKSPAYQERLQNANIAVLLGRASGDICAIDLDSDKAVEEFLGLNSRLKRTLRTKGSRGCQIWARFTGEYEGKIVKFADAASVPVGEWRGDGCSMIAGLHPDGMDYEFVVEAPVVSISFTEIVWPQDWKCPWRKSEYQKLVDSAGEPFRDGSGGILNQQFFCHKYAVEHQVLFETDSLRFYKYNVNNGAYEHVTEARLKTSLSEDVKHFADQQDGDARKKIMHAANNRFLVEVIQLLKGKTERREGFHGIPEWIHAANCMVFPCLDEVFEMPFSASYYSRNQCPIDFVRDAKCPRFLEMLNAVLKAEDVDLMQRMFGYVLKRGNPCHKIFLMTGRSATSKSTIVAILEGLVGWANVGQLRAQHLGSRFELGGVLGKTLLTGKDVPADFLKSRDAEGLKSMVGGDRLEAERKGVNERTALSGTFNVVIASNHSLTIRASGDHDAWKRRLIKIEFARPFTGKRIPAIHVNLLREEGPGILNWAIQGMIQVNREIDAHGDFILTPTQQQRVDEMLVASDSLARFLNDRVIAGGGNLSTEELTGEYAAFCNKRQWPAESEESVSKLLPELMCDLFRSEKSHSIARSTGPVRGFRGVTWRN